MPEGQVNLPGEGLSKLQMGAGVIDFRAITSHPAVATPLLVLIRVADMCWRPTQLTVSVLAALISCIWQILVVMAIASQWTHGRIPLMRFFSGMATGDCQPLVGTPTASRQNQTGLGVNTLSFVIRKIQNSLL